MNNIDRQYLELVEHILRFGNSKNDRTGTSTKSIFGWQIRHSMKDGFPLITTKKMAWKTMATELLWFLRGNTHIKFLHDNGCHIWDGDLYKFYTSKGGKDYSEKSMKQISSHFSQEEFINKIKTDDEFAKKWGELGPIYGKQWRSWGRKNVVNYNLENVKSSDKVKVMDLIRDGGDYSKYDVKVTYQNNSIDQIQNLINQLKNNPDSRRLMVNAWNVGELDQMVLPPCHYGFQVYTRELDETERVILMDKKLGVTENLPQYYTEDEMIKHHIPKRAISLQWTQRSVDVGLGLPFNIASYALLLELVAKSVNMVPEELIGNLGDCHIYNNHVDGLKEQLERIPYELPKLNINTEWWPTESGECGVGPIDATAVFNSFTNDHFCECLLEDDIQLYNYQSHPAIKLPLSN